MTERVKERARSYRKNFESFKRFAARKDVFIFKRSALPGEEITYRDYTYIFSDEMPVTGETWPAEA